jgi:DNA-binding transcriptional ArsR family regulator
MTGPGLLEHNRVKALGHPLRLRLLDAIIENGEESPVRLSRQLGHPLSTVSRHIRMLRDLGFVELTRTEPRRGAVEHFYRAVRLAFIDDDEWERLPIAMRRGLAHQTFRKIFAEASTAGGAGGFDAAEAHLVRVPLDLDEIGRRELSQALRDVLGNAEAIQQRSDARRNGATGPSGAVTATRLALMHFRADEGAGQSRSSTDRAARSDRPTFP